MRSSGCVVVSMCSLGWGGCGRFDCEGVRYLGFQMYACYVHGTENSGYPRFSDTCVV